MMTSIVIVLACVVAAMLLTWFYFRRYAIKRSPIGVINLRDTVFIMVNIIFVPFLYLWLPIGVVAVLIALQAFSMMYFTWEPILRSRGLLWMLAATLPGADIAASILNGPSSAFFAVNNLVLLGIVVGVGNLLVQSGMKARDVALLGAFLTVYDFSATGWLPLTSELVRHLAGLPFSPMFAWPVAGGSWVGLGLGDVLFAALSPLAMRKAFGRTAGLGTLGTGLAGLIFVFLLPIHSIFPGMMVLGPLMVAQYLYWHRRTGTERTTRQYLLAEPV